LAVLLDGVQPPSFTGGRKRLIQGKAMPVPVGVGVVFARPLTGRIAKTMTKGLRNECSNIGKY